MDEHSPRIAIDRVETIFEGWGRLTLSHIDYRWRDGRVQQLSREVYDHGNAAAMLLVDPARDTVLLVRQFRFPAHLNGDPPDLLEVCAGLLDGEAPEVAAAREALEETGHEPRDVTHVCDVYASPGSVTEKVSLFIGHYNQSTFRHEAIGIEAEGEELELVELPFETAFSMIASGGIIDAKTVILLQHLALTRR